MPDDDTSQAASTTTTTSVPLATGVTGVGSIQPNTTLPPNVTLETRTTPPPVVDEPLREPGKAALVAERERADAETKRAKELEARLKVIEDRDLSELERARKAQQEAVNDASAAKAEALRYKVATRYGINDEDAELFLNGGAENVLVKQAERFVAVRNEPAQTQGNRQPKPDPSQGTRTTDNSPSVDAGRARYEAKKAATGTTTTPV